MSTRPKTLEQFQGQTRIKKALEIFTKAARNRGIPMDHTLFYGPPGLGKTTLANVVATEQGGRLFYLNGGVITSVDQIVSVVQELTPGGMDVIFIDEIHRIPMEIEEVLYEVLEDFCITIPGKDDAIYRVPIPKFTMIGATTLLGNLSRPFRDRFPIKLELEPYTSKELDLIIVYNAVCSGMRIDPFAIMAISRRSRGTARVAINFLRRAYDVSCAKGKDIIEEDDVLDMFELLEISEEGLTKADRNYLSILSTEKPKGIRTISAALGENPKNIEEVIEPFLVRCGFVEVTARGRLLTSKGQMAIYGGQ